MLLFCYVSKPACYHASTKSNCTVLSVPCTTICTADKHTSPIYFAGRHVGSSSGFARRNAFIFFHVGAVLHCFVLVWAFWSSFIHNSTSRSLIHFTPREVYEHFLSDRSLSIILLLLAQVPHPEDTVGGVYILVATCRLIRAGTRWVSVCWSIVISVLRAWSSSYRYS